jgi:predicted lipoprotein with Yx(FWY)xxD motif
MHTRLQLMAALLTLVLITAACNQQISSGYGGTPLATALIPATGSTPTARTGSPSGPVTKVSAAQDAKLGSILVDGAGRTLYALMRDTPTVSTCYDQCAATWPPFVSGASSVSAETGIAASQIGTITRQDGAKQVVYNGWPLYYFSGDKAAGEVNGQGFGRVWFVVSPEGNLIKK